MNSIETLNARPAGQRPIRPHGAGASRPPFGPGAALCWRCIVWAGDMEMNCERFEVVEDLADMEPVE